MKPLEVDDLHKLQMAYRRFAEVHDEVLADLLAFSGVWSMNLAETPLEMARNEGRRMVGLRILSMLDRFNLEEESLCRMKA